MAILDIAAIVAAVVATAAAENSPEITQQSTGRAGNASQQRTCRHRVLVSPPRLSVSGRLCFLLVFIKEVVSDETTANEDGDKKDGFSFHNILIINQSLRERKYPTNCWACRVDQCHVHGGLNGIWCQASIVDETSMRPGQGQHAPSKGSGTPASPPAPTTISMTISLFIESESCSSMEPDGELITVPGLVVAGAGVETDACRGPMMVAAPGLFE